jgi:hypothetical protein
LVNAAYNILMANSGYERMIKFLVGEHALKKYDNVYRLTFAEDGLWPYIKDWPAIEQFMLSRLRDEAASTQNNDLFLLYEEISRLRTNQNPIDFRTDDNLPIMSITFTKDDLKASFFTAITTLGTPLDLTTQELRIESLFPANEDTKELFSHGFP